MIGKFLRKIVQKWPLMCYMLKNISCLLFKTNTNHEKQIILLMLPNGEGWHYLAVKHDSDLYCLNYLHFLEQWRSGQGAGFLIQGFHVQNHWLAPRSTQLFILPKVNKTSTRNFWIFEPHP